MVGEIINMKHSIGNVPEGWEYLRLSKISDINPSYKLVNGNIYDFIEMASLPTEGRKIQNITTRKYGTTSGSRFKQGDILFARITPCTENGKMGLVKSLRTDYGIGSTEFIVISPHEETVDSDYLYYFLKLDSVRNYAVNRMVGTTGRQRVPHEVFKEELYIFLPPLPEQRKIADILSTVEEQIEHTDTLIEKTKELKKGLMQQLLTKGIGHTKFKRTELGEIPEEWEIKRFGDILTLEYGFNLPEKDRNGGAYPVYGSNGIVGYHDTFSVKAPGIIMGRKGSIDKVAYAKIDFCPIDTTYYVVNSSNDWKWLYYLISIQDLRSLNAATGVPSLSRNDFYLLKITVPPLDEQRHIASVLSEFDKHIENQLDQKGRLELLKQGLMQKLLTGQIRVNVS